MKAYYGRAGLSIIDIIAVIIVWFCAISGWRRGFLEVALDMGSFLLSMALALLLCPQVPDLINTGSFSPAIICTISFLLIFLIARIISRPLAVRLYYRMPPEAKNSDINRILGTLPGVSKGLVIYSLVLAFVAASPSSESGKVVTESCLGPEILQCGLGIQNAAAPMLTAAALDCISPAYAESRTANTAKQVAQAQQITGTYKITLESLLPNDPTYANTYQNCPRNTDPCSQSEGNL